MRALVKKPGFRAQPFDLAEAARPQLAAMQSAVGGYVETAVRGRGFVVWCNEEGKLRGLVPHFQRPTDGDLIVGSVIVTGPIVSSLEGGVPTPIAAEDMERVIALLDLWECGVMVPDLDDDDLAMYRSLLDAETKEQQP